jgi:hypothetical protein
LSELARSFEKEKDWRLHPDYGIAIGYHYLGGHSHTHGHPRRVYEHVDFPAENQ